MPSRFFSSFRFSFSFARDFLLGERVVPAVGDHGLEIAEPAEAALNGREVGEEAAEPALVDEEHPAALRFFRDDVLGLPLGADEQDRLAVRRQVRDELLGVAELLHRLVQIDDVDAVPLSEDVFLHLRVPPLRLVAEVHSGFEQILDRNPGQASSLLLSVY